MRVLQLLAVDAWASLHRGGTGPRCVVVGHSSSPPAASRSPSTVSSAASNTWPARSSAVRQPYQRPRADRPLCCCSPGPSNRPAACASGTARPRRRGPTVARSRPHAAPRYEPQRSHVHTIAFIGCAGQRRNVTCIGVALERTARLGSWAAAPAASGIRRGARTCTHTRGIRWRPRRGRRLDLAGRAGEGTVDSCGLGNRPVEHDRRELTAGERCLSPSASRTSRLTARTPRSSRACGPARAPRPRPGAPARDAMQASPRPAIVSASSQPSRSPCPTRKRPARGARPSRRVAPPVAAGPLCGLPAPRTRHGHPNRPPVSLTAAPSIVHPSAANAAAWIAS